MKTILLFWAILLVPISIRAQVWNRTKGSGYVQLGYSQIKANGLFLEGSTETLDLHREVNDQTLQIYAEYGLTDKWTLSAVLPYKIVSTSEETFPSLFQETLPKGELSGLGQIQLAAVYQLMQKNGFVVSAKGRLEANTPAEMKRIDRTGTDSWGLGGWIQSGYGGKYLFASAQAGVNLRSNDYSHQFVGQLEGGAHFKQRLFFITTLEILQSFENGTFQDGNALQTGLYVREQEYIAFQIKLGGYPLPGLGLWLATGGLSAATRWPKPGPLHLTSAISGKRNSRKSPGNAQHQVGVGA
ncbi:MAG: hypothetical protein HC913_18025 [Microscillaceae bacterium]|nr:hypothetical protein [Microscillaceae bacterium]